MVVVASLLSVVGFLLLAFGIGGAIAGAIGLGQKARWGQPLLISAVIAFVAGSACQIALITVAGNEIRDLFHVSTERMQGDPDAKLDPSVSGDARGSVTKRLWDWSGGWTDGTGSRRPVTRLSTEKLGGDSDARLDSSITSSAKGQVHQDLSKIKE